MQLSSLRYFLEVARWGSIRRAGEVLHVAASAVSRQIALLEQELGTPLLERHALGVRLTAAGEVFARQARATLRDLERAKSEIDDLAQLRRGNIRIYTSEGAVADLLFGALSEFSKRYPGITYDVVVAGSRKAIDGVAQEECDFGIVFNPEPHSEVTILRSAQHPVCAVMHPHHPLGKRTRIDLDDLQDVAVCLLDHTFAVRHLIDQAIATEQKTLKVALTINSVEFAKIFARDGMGITFLPFYAVRREVADGSLKAIPTSHPLLSTSTVALCMHRTRTVPLAAEELMKVLAKHFSSFAVTD